MSKRYVVRLYVGIANGPGCATTLVGHLREFFFGAYRTPRKWHSGYSSARGQILLPHWRWGPFKWGMSLQPAPARKD